MAAHYCTMRRRVDYYEGNQICCRRFTMPRFSTLPFVLVLITAATALASEPEFLLEWGKKGDQPGEFYSPIGLAFTSDERFVVTDLNNARVQIFSTEGKPLGGFDLPRDAPERKSTIIGGIAIDGDDLVYLAFMNQHKLAVYRTSGELVREWGKMGTVDGEFHQPGGIVFVSESELLVADQCNHRVQRFTKTGEHLATWGGYGTADGQFDGIGTPGSRFGGPHFLAKDSQGRIYTTEGIAGRVQQFTIDGKFLLKWGDKTDEPGGFGAYEFGNLPHTFGPIGVAVDKHDRMFVSSLNDRVQCFDTAGKFQFAITTTGQENGQLLHPHGMAFDKEGCLYIADAGNQRIVKFRLPEAK
jgi:sugar lactone lactonase YvrE